MSRIVSLRFYFICAMIAAVALGIMIALLLGPEEKQNSKDINSLVKVFFDESIMDLKSKHIVRMNEMHINEDSEQFYRVKIVIGVIDESLSTGVLKLSIVSDRKIASQAKVKIQYHISGLCNPLISKLRNRLAENGFVDVEWTATE